MFNRHLSLSSHRYIDHGNGLLTLRIMDTFDLDAGYYECVVRNVEGQIIKTHCELVVEDVDCCYIEPTVCFLKKPLPLIAFPEDIAVFCAKVHPPNIRTKWMVNGRAIQVESSGYQVSSFEIYYFIYLKTIVTCVKDRPYSYISLLYFCVTLYVNYHVQQVDFLLT